MDDTSANTGIAGIAADLGVEPHELAQVILQHVPGGKIRVHERDAVNPIRPLAGDVTAWFGHAVREARKARRLTQVELAKKLSDLLDREFAPLTVTRIELGQRPTPLDEVAALAHCLDLSVDALIREASTSTDGEVGA